MTNSAGISSITQPSANAPVAAGASAAAAAATSTVDTKPLTGGTSTPISPRIVVDPLAGVITQFLSSTGQLESQIPSAAVVAYLRAGLTPQGLTKPTALPHSHDQQPDSHAKNNSILA